MRLNKKFIKMLAIGVVSAFSLFGTATVYAANLGFITEDQVNVRSGASTDAEILQQISTGQTVTVVSVQGDWLELKLKDGSAAFVKQGFVKLVQADGVINANNVNIRAVPATNGTVLGSAGAGDLFGVYGLSGDFYEIDYKGTKAFVHKDYIAGDLLALLPPVAFEQAAASVVPLAAPEPAALPPVQPAVESEYALITSATGLNLRSAPSQDAEVLATLQPGLALDLIEKGGAWNKVSYNGTEGYVSAEFVSINFGVKPENDKGTTIVEYAKQFLGTPYAWSGTNLRKGVDCSGFTYAVMRDNGIAVNRSSRDQYRNGYEVSKDALKAGDLVFFDTTNATNQGYISHVGLYMGGGQFIHSSSSRKSYCVTISSRYEDYYV
ncbi:MAG: SH3 domain-containing protein, partial [Clostridiales bacterium]|nr:SH3 domain-containing protein [Clostridiales bacterium]